MVLFSVLTEIAVGAVLVPALVHNPCESWTIVKSLALIFARIVPTGRVMVIVSPVEIELIGVKSVKPVSPTPT